MGSSYQDLIRLGDLLEAELNGHEFDADELNHLAASLTHKYPEISGTLNRMMERQSARR